MLRAYEDNYTLLNKIYKQEQNTLMTTRLKNAKSIVNTHCPHSFNGVRKKANKSEKKIWVNNQYIIWNNILLFIVKNYDIKRGNMILYQKLYDIDKNGRQTISKSLKPVFKFKKNTREDYVKNEIKSLAQENLFILKKLLSKNSEYSTHKMEKQYQQSQKI